VSTPPRPPGIPAYGGARLIEDWNKPRRASLHEKKLDGQEPVKGKPLAANVPARHCLSGRDLLARRNYRDTCWRWRASAERRRAGSPRSASSPGHFIKTHAPVVARHARPSSAVLARRSTGKSTAAYRPPRAQRELEKASTTVAATRRKRTLARDAMRRPTGRAPPSDRLAQPECFEAPAPRHLDHARQRDSRSQKLGLKLWIDDELMAGLEHEQK